MNLYIICLIFCHLCTNFLNADDVEDEVNIFLEIQEPIIVSLGSTCEVAHFLRNCNMRKAAFPFDWITTIDSEKFLDVLDQDFRHFFDEDFLYVGGSGPGPLIHSYYRIEFLHEGDFRGGSYAPNMEKLKVKYKRRINRFRSLSEYQGKVIFVRTAFQYSTTDPHRYYFCANNLEITDEYATRLYQILRNHFPLLDFSLVVINHHGENEVKEEKRIGDNIIKIRINPYLDHSVRWGLYKNYFEELLTTESRIKCCKVTDEN